MGLRRRDLGHQVAEQTYVRLSSRIVGRRPASKLGVAEASLYGARCRLVDLDRSRDKERAVRDMGEAQRAVAEAVAKVISLGGDPNEERLFPSHGPYLDGPI